MNRDRYTQQRVIDAIVQARGIKTTAAESLGCSRQTITNYLDRYPAVKAAYDEANESTLDLAESKLIALVEKEEWPAIRFLLVTKGKDRGYVERQETSSPTRGKGIQQLGGDIEQRFRQFEEEARRIHPE
jgi:hypothetical protein